MNKHFIHVVFLLLAGFFFCIPDANGQRFTLDAQAESFYTESVRQLDSVRVMDTSDKARLRDFFTGYLCSNGDLKWSLQLAMSRVTDYPLYYFVLFKEDIIKLSNKWSDWDVRELRVEHHQPDSCIRELIPIIRRKNSGLAIFDKMYVLNDSLLQQKKEMLSTRYASRKRQFLMAHPHFSKNYDLVLRSSRALGLNEAQTDSIFCKGEEVRAYLSRNANYDFWKHERTHLKNILTIDQYDRFLTLKHLPKARQSAEDCWDKLKEFNAESGLDSIVVIRQVTAYHLERSKLFDLYAYDDSAQYNTLAAELYCSFCPPAVRRVNEMMNNKNSQKTYQGSYAW